MRGGEVGHVTADLSPNSPKDRWLRRRGGLASADYWNFSLKFSSSMRHVHVVTVCLWGGRLPACLPACLSTFYKASYVSRSQPAVLQH